MMFASKSPYSPFFTSGLLSNSEQPEYRSFLSMHSARISESDSLRSIPSPKPAPSITLPELPPRLPSLIPIPPLELPLPYLTISRTPAPLTVIRRISVATKATSSSVSTRVRGLNRSEALARLEGRSKHGHLKPPQRNFMNMTDDEDEEDHDIDFDFIFADSIFPNPVLEPEDVVLPTSFLQAPRTAPLPSRPTDSFFVTAPHSLRRHKSQVPSTKDWFPLKSFIDLHSDDDSSSWAWRSFIHVANVS